MTLQKEPEGPGVMKSSPQLCSLGSNSPVEGETGLQEPGRAGPGQLVNRAELRSPPTQQLIRAKGSPLAVHPAIHPEFESGKEPPHISSAGARSAPAGHITGGVCRKDVLTAEYLPQAFDSFDPDPQRPPAMPRWPQAPRATHLVVPAHS